jgi:hypothetical protein
VCVPVLVLLPSAGGRFPRTDVPVVSTGRRTIEGNVKVLQYRALKYARQLHEDDYADGEGDKEEQSL